MRSREVLQGGLKGRGKVWHSARGYPLTLYAERALLVRETALSGAGPSPALSTPGENEKDYRKKVKATRSRQAFLFSSGYGITPRRMS